MSQVSQAHKLRVGGAWLGRDRPRPGLLNDRSRPRSLSLLPKKSTTRHTWLQWDIGSWAFYSGDCGLRIEQPSAGQMDSQGLCISTLQVTLWGLFKAQSQQAPSEWEAEKGKEAGCVFNRVLQLKNTQQRTEPQLGVPGCIPTSSDISLGSLSTTE